MKICPACSNVYADSLQLCPRDQTSLTPFRGDLRPGDQLRGKYEVVEELGRGGMATVYKVRHLAFHDFVAVKLVHAELLADQDFLKRFRNEAVVARQLRHPNAVQIEDFDFSDAGQPFIVMEYINGRSLYDARKQMPEAWPVDVALRLASGVAGALEAAHALGIVHRDIKPANILLTRTPDGREVVKVSDFGVAKVDERAFAGMTSVKTQANMIIGTPEYMSPEQAMASDLTKIDGRSDLYSLGVVLYELLTGAHPFRADTPIAMLMHQVQTQPDAPHILDGSISPALSALILKALRKSPEERFQTAGEMLAALHDPEAWYRRQPPLHAPSQPSARQEAATAMFTAPAQLGALRPETPPPISGVRPPLPLPPRPSAPSPSQRREAMATHASQPSRPRRSSGSSADPVVSRESRSSALGTFVLILLLVAVAVGVYYYLESEGLFRGETPHPALVLEP